MPVSFPENLTTIVIEDDRSINHTQEKLIRLMKLNRHVLDFHGSFDPIRRLVSFETLHYEKYVAEPAKHHQDTFQLGHSRKSCSNVWLLNLPSGCAVFGILRSDPRNFLGPGRAA